ncbi:MAG: transporter [Tatlockia sp.]|nr:transporter [Tatlockia sp.]
MATLQGWLLTTGILISAASFKIFAEPPPLCSGPNAFLSIVNRPTVADSACTVPTNKMVFELGYQAMKLDEHSQIQNFPNSELRFGLPWNSEFFVFLPNYNRQKMISSSETEKSSNEPPALMKPNQPAKTQNSESKEISKGLSEMFNDNTSTTTRFSGLSDTIMGFKHIVKGSKKMLLTFEASITPPSGSKYFGSAGTEALVAGIFNYKLTKKLATVFQLSFTTLTDSKFDGGRRYNSVNPDAVISWSLKDNLQIYGEIFGQSKTGPDEGSGFNMDAGIEYLLAKNITIDLSAGQRISGQLWSLENYINTGMAVQF